VFGIELLEAELLEKYEFQKARLKEEDPTTN